MAKAHLLLQHTSTSFCTADGLCESLALFSIINSYWLQAYECSFPSLDRPTLSPPLVTGYVREQDSQIPVRSVLSV
jgi:hypothetical protein